VNTKIESIAWDPTRNVLTFNDDENNVWGYFDNLTSSGLNVADTGNDSMMADVEGHRYMPCLVVSQDFGDWNGAGAQTTTTSSVVSATLRLGALVDAETSVTPDGNATMDDITGGTDDEDGIRLDTLRAGYASTVLAVVTNLTGSPAYLNGWIDFNNDGTFDPVTEKIVNDHVVATGTSAVERSVSFTVPLVSAATVGARFRLTSTSAAANGLLPTGASGTGEVEDMVVSLLPACAASTLYIGEMESSANNGHVFRFNLNTGAELPPSPFITPGSTLEGLTGINNTLIVATSPNYSNVGAKLSLYDRTTGVLQRVFPTNCYMLDIAVSPDGQFVYGVGSNPTGYTAAMKLRLSDGALLANYSTFDDAWGCVVQPVTGDVFTAQGSRLATVTSVVSRFDPNLSAATTITGTAAAAGRGYTGIVFVSPTEFVVCERNKTTSGTDATPSTLRRFRLTSSTSNTATLIASFQASPTSDLTDAYDLSYVGDQNVLLASSQTGGCVVKFNATTNAWIATLVNAAASPSYAKTIYVDCPTTKSVLASLGNQVFLDGNNNGLKDGADAGIDGVGVSLAFDANGDADFLDAGEMSYLTTTTANGGYYSFGVLAAGRYQVSIPTPPSAAQASSGPTVSTDNGVDNDDNGTQASSGAVTVGPVIILSAGEDEGTVDFGFLPPGLDFGDAPASYGTASHIIIPGVGLGVLVDAEAAALSNATATGDDVAGSAPDDEEGVFFDQPVVPGRETSVILSTRGLGYANLWIDFNRDGDFADAGEQVITNTAVGFLATDQPPLQGIPIVHRFTVPANAVSGASVARARFTSDVLTLGPTGAATSGEVEDLAVTIQPASSVGGTLWADGDANGVRSNVELPVSGLVLTLLRSDGKAEAITTADAAGNYLFSALPAGSYTVQVRLPSGYGLSLRDVGGDDAMDSDFTPATGLTPALVLASGASSLRVDAGVQGTGPSPRRVTVAALKPPVASTWVQGFVLPKFDPALGTLTGVEVQSTFLKTHDFLMESDSNGASTSTLDLTYAFRLTLPNATSQNLAFGQSFSRNIATFDGHLDYHGTSGFAEWDLHRETRFTSASYAVLADFVGLSAADTVSLTGDVDVDSTIFGPGSAVQEVRSRIGCAVTVTYTFSPPCPVITVGSRFIPAGYVGSLYTGTTLVAAGGTGPYGFTVTAGSLPTGLTLSAAGVLSGTPTATATAQPLTITATDVTGCQGSMSTTLTIRPAIVNCGARLFVADYGNPTDGLRIFDPVTTAFAGTIASPFPDAGTDGPHTAFNVEEFGGHLYTATWWGCAVAKHSQAGVFLGFHIPSSATFSLIAGGTQTMSNCGNFSTFKFDSLGRIYIVFFGGSVVRFNADGTGGQQLIGGGDAIGSLAIDPVNNDLYVRTNAAPGLRRYASTGALISSMDIATNFGGGALGAWNPNNGFGMEVRNGRVYLMHSNSAPGSKVVLEVIYRAGQAVWNTDFRTFLTLGDATDPRDMAFNPDNTSLYVSDAAASRVWIVNGLTGGAVSSHVAAGAPVTLGLAFACTPPCPVISFAPVILNMGLVNVPYVQGGTLSASGGTGPYSFTVKTGALPAGLTLNPNGTITGTPTVVVSATPLTFEATDSLGCRGVSPTVVLSINPQPMPCPARLFATDDGGSAFLMLARILIRLRLPSRSPKRVRIRMCR
jgi:SdrD B-like domain/GEVED domain/Putative Ig domain